MKVGCIGFFDSMHLLPGHPKCGVPHGHTWKVEVIAEGPVVRGMVMDFADLKKAMKETVAAFDHTDLNTLLPIPTCEYITFELMRRLKERVPQKLTVRVWEGEGKWAELEEGPGVLDQARAALEEARTLKRNGTPITCEVGRG